MKFDRFLNTLFRRGIIIIPLVLTLAVCVFSFVGCFVHDLGACALTSLRCEGGAESCSALGEACDEKMLSCLPSGCVADCLFNSEGSTFLCGNAVVHCGGCNSTCYESLEGREDGTWGCNHVDGHYRITCGNCISYCDGASDPAAPEYK